MRTLRAFLVRLASTLHRGRGDSEMLAELESHLQMQIDENLRVGMSAEEARRSALLRSGGVESAKEAYRDRRGLPAIENLCQDVRYSIRALRNNPSFTAVIVLTLALGIGANTAIFSLIDAVLLRMLPVSHPEQLAFVSTTAVQTGSIRVARSISNEALAQMNQRAQRVSGLAAFRIAASLNIGVDGQVNPGSGQFVSSNYFQVLGVAPRIGRTINPEENHASDRVADLSYGYWQRRFGGNPDIVGRSISINKVQFTVVGVTPSEFYGLSADSAPDVIMPSSTARQVEAGRVSSDEPKPGDSAGNVFTRLAAGASLKDAGADLSPILRQALLAALPGESNADQRAAIAHLSAELTPASQGLSRVRERFSKPLEVLMVVVGLVMLIACANVANLMLARSTARHREIAIRLSLGSTRARLVRQLLVDSLLLSLLGAFAGIPLGVWARYGIVYMAGAQGAAIPWEWNGTIFAFTAVISILNAALFGLIPALRATQFDFATALRTGRQSQNLGKRSLSRALVVCQTSLSLVLLVGAALFLGTFRNLDRIDLGFARENTWMVTLDARTAGYQGARASQLFQDALERVQNVPGVRSVSLTRQRFLTGQVYMNSVWVPGYALAKDEAAANLWVMLNRVGPNFFSTSGMRLESGRDFTRMDNQHSPKVAVINETMAHHFFAGSNPIGQRIAWSRATEPDIEIVGVVRDAKYIGVRDEKQDVIFTAFLQDPEAWTEATLLVRSASNSGTITGGILAALHTVDPGLAVSAITTVDEQVARTLVEERLLAVLSSAFGLLALGLSAIGLYGVLSYGVAQRTGEIGVRMALGARGSGILRMVLGEAAWLVGISAVAGLAAAISAGRLVQSMLYGVSPTDSIALGAAVALLLLIAGVAASVPAWRAARVDPMVALRHE